jgi:F420-non-reducing hydrogenase iron-sulfur subunit
MIRERYLPRRLNIPNPLLKQEELLEIMQDSTRITMFVCANCARAGKELTSAGRTRPVVPDFNLPGRIHSIVVPCTGRLQPEHILKAFESGSSVVSIVACQEDNCHYAEGSRRCALRVELVQGILKEIGLGEGRLLLSHLPGSAAEDLAIAAGKSGSSNDTDSMNVRIAAIRERIVETLQAYPPNPLLQSPPMEKEESYEEEIAFSDGEESDA